MHYGSVALLSHNTLKWSEILGLSFFVQCWRPRESVLWGSSMLSEFRTSLSKVLTLRHCVKLKQRYHNGVYFFLLVIWCDLKAFMDLILRVPSGNLISEGLKSHQAGREIADRKKVNTIMALQFPPWKFSMFMYASPLPSNTISGYVSGTYCSSSAMSD